MSQTPSDTESNLTDDPTSPAVDPAIATSASAPSRLPTFAAGPYRPDGGFRTSGLILLFTTLLIVGAVLGVAAFFISKFVYLIVLFPVLIGLALGFSGIWAVKQGNIRNPLIGGLAGLVGGIAAMMVIHVAEYEDFKTTLAKVRPETLAEIRSMSPDERQEIIDKELDSEKREELKVFIQAATINGFAQFMDFSAHEGVSISNHGSKGINLGYTGTYIYWAVEAGIVAIITLLILREVTAKPFCVACKLWKKPLLLTRFQGDINMATTSVNTGNAAAISRQPDSERGPIGILTAYYCPLCKDHGQTEIFLDSETLDAKGRKQTRSLAKSSYPQGALPTLATAFGKST
jgi:hypothetical protein